MSTYIPNNLQRPRKNMTSRGLLARVLEAAISGFVRVTKFGEQEIPAAPAHPAPAEKINPAPRTPIAPEDSRQVRRRKEILHCKKLRSQMSQPKPSWQDIRQALREERADARAN